MFIVSKALLISSATVIVRAGGGGIWLNTFATVLFSVCCAVTVERCVLYPCCMGVFDMCNNNNNIYLKSNIQCI